eukprot:79207-Chlamydomonas_euryale.AAC.1
MLLVRLADPPRRGLPARDARAPAGGARRRHAARRGRTRGRGRARRGAGGGEVREGRACVGQGLK